MKTRRLYTWQFFVGAFIGGFICFILGAVLGTFLFMKNVDVLEIKKKQEYIIQEVEELRKERQAIMDLFKEKGLIEDWNEQAIVVEPEEEGK